MSLPKEHNYNFVVQFYYLTDIASKLDSYNYLVPIGDALTW